MLKKLTGWFEGLFGGRLLRMARIQERQAQVRLLPLPATVTLGQLSFALRRMSPSDGDAIVSFARKLPEHDLLFLRRDITDPSEVAIWIELTQAGRYTTLIAEHAGAIVGYATVASEGMTWARDVAELRVLVAPAFRGSGLGRLLVEQSFAVARDRGVRKMVAQMTVDQPAALRVFERMGFEAEATLRDHVVDRDGKLHDLRIMSLDVARFQAKLSAAMALAEAPHPDM